MAKLGEGYEGSDGRRYRILRAEGGLPDTTPIYRGRYDSRCDACWLGYGHSEELHAQDVQRQARFGEVGYRR